jgi:hypothetical protein
VPPPPSTAIVDRRCFTPSPLLAKERDRERKRLRERNKEIKKERRVGSGGRGKKRGSTCCLFSPTIFASGAPNTPPVKIDFFLLAAS